MPETPKINQEPVKLDEAIRSLLEQGIGDPASAQAEADRKRQANLTDAENAVRDTAEQRAELIERAQGGEAIDPDAMRYAGELALETRARGLDLKPDEVGNNNP